MTPSNPATRSLGSISAIRCISARAQIALAACACGGATAFLYAVDPNHHSVYPQCLFYNATGLYCAGCGTTRAMHALLHGRVIEALHDNALFVAALPLILYVVVTYALSVWRSNAWPQIDVNPTRLTRRGMLIFLLMVGFMLARNLPGWPFDWLKPVPSGL